MTRVFTDKIVFSGEPFNIVGEDVAHLSFSLRAKEGETLMLISRGMEYFSTITAFSKNSVTVLPGEGVPAKGEPAVKVTLYVGLPKGDKLELVTQKAVEMGATRIVPFVAERSVTEPNAKKAERLRKIAKEAASQCGRGIIPEVSTAMGFDVALAEGRKADITLFCHEGGGTVPLSEIIKERKYVSVAIFTGPEGGFSQTEFDKAKSLEYNLVWLGNRILRCETAPLCVLAAVMYSAAEF